MIKERNPYKSVCDRIRNAIKDAEINTSPWYKRIFHLNYIKHNSYNFSWITAANYIRRCIESFTIVHPEYNFPLLEYKVSTWREKLYNKNDIRICKDYCYFVLHYIDDEIIITNKKGKECHHTSE